ncbi:T9SS type A sorting domain-containing protein [Chitinophagaceae bacterium MMS25-I14]
MNKYYSLLFALAVTSVSFSVHAQRTYNTSASIDINNVRAASLLHGDMWYDPSSATPRCEYPKGSGKHVAFVGGVWMGGYDQQGNLKVAAQTYRQQGNDYWPGPLDNSGITDSTTVDKWARIWKINKSTIDSFRHLSSHTVANTPAAVLEWPAKGNPFAKGNNGVSLIVTTDMAPFKDVNNDGVYNPQDGDYPDIKGDQMLWYVYNDAASPHANSLSDAIHAETHVSVFAYNRGGILDNVIYYQYSIQNKSNASYPAFRMAMMADMDLGYAFDDYIGFDSVHRMGIIYNSSGTDGAGQPNSYGTNIPIAGVSMIQLPGDGIHSPQPAGSFTMYNNDNSAIGNPANGMQFNGYMRSINRAGQHFKNPITGADANYIFPDDPSLTGGWSECARNDTPGDRRFVIASNDFTLQAGATQTVVMALIVQPQDTDNACPHTRFTTIKNMADNAWNAYYNPPPSLGVNTIAAVENIIKLYPNPAGDKAYLETGVITPTSESIKLYDAMGRVIVLPYSRQGAKIELNTATLAPGIYTLQYFNGAVAVSRKLEKL